MLTSNMRNDDRYRCIVVAKGVLEGRGRKDNRKAGKKTLKVQVPAADASRNGEGGEREGEGACTQLRC